MEVLLAKKKPMSELAAPLKIYPQVLENVRVTDNIKALSIQERSLTMSRRKDNKGRVLRTGESQRKDLIYQYRYTDV